jgi:hypothetical protein
VVICSSVDTQHKFLSGEIKKKFTENIESYKSNPKRFHKKHVLVLPSFNVALRIMLAYFTTDAVFPVHSPLDFYT